MKDKFCNVMKRRNKIQHNFLVSLLTHVPFYFNGMRSSLHNSPTATEEMVGMDERNQRLYGFVRISNVKVKAERR